MISDSLPSHLLQKYVKIEIYKTIIYLLFYIGMKFFIILQED
jgi:hypothetical protein